MRLSRQSRLRRTAGLAALTVVVSKKASIGARRRASAVIAAAKSSAASAGASAASAVSRAAKRARSASVSAKRGSGSSEYSTPSFFSSWVEDVHGALVAGEEVRAVVGGEEGLQRADAGDEEDEVVLAAELEGGVDDVVADALAAEVDLEAVGEEGEEVSRTFDASTAMCTSVLSARSDRSLESSDARAMRSDMLLDPA